MCLSVLEIDTTRNKIVLIHDFQAHQGVKFQLHEFINSAVDGCEWSASRNGHLPSAERAPEYSLDRRMDGFLSRCRHFGNTESASESGDF